MPYRVALPRHHPRRVQTILYRTKAKSASGHLEHLLDDQHFWLVHYQPVSRGVVPEAKGRLWAGQQLSFSRLTNPSSPGPFGDFCPLVLGELILDSAHECSFGAVVPIVVERPKRTAALCELL